MPYSQPDSLSPSFPFKGIQLGTFVRALAQTDRPRGFSVDVGGGRGAIQKSGRECLPGELYGGEHLRRLDVLFDNVMTN